jgi:phosphohistidine phosphatase
MNLILWRHAEAIDLGTPVTPGCKRDLERQLTDRGQQQAAATARWLKTHLKRDYRVISSPAIRALQTAQAFTDKTEIIPELCPLADASHVLAAINWPQGKDVVVVGHQPWLGRVASLLLSGQEQDWSIKKSALWWLCHRVRKQEDREMPQTVLRLVLPSELANTC